MRKLFGKAKTIWNNLSVTRRKQLKVAAVSATAVAGGVTLTIVAGSLLAGLGFVAAIAGTTGTIRGLRGLKNEIQHGQEKVRWKNAAGQTIESTRTQQMDLEKYINVLNPPDRIEGTAGAVGRHSLKMARFNAVAVRVTVVKDIEGHDNTFFRFAPPAPTPKFRSLV